MRLQRAKEYLAYCREAENDSRRSLNDAVNRTKRAKEKYDDLFDACEKRACARIRAERNSI